jgi:hypothetical protein
MQPNLTQPKTILTIRVPFVFPFSLFCACVDVNHHLEHQLVGVKEGLLNTINKLKKAEKDDQLRIQNLETQVMGKVENKLANNDVAEKVGESLKYRVDRLQKTIEQAVDARLKALEKQMHMKQGSLEVSMDQKIAASGGGWFWPFLLLVISLCGVGFFMYRKYVELRKSHLL